MFAYTVLTVTLQPPYSTNNLGGCWESNPG
nr:MAG TPA: hypothetical protein [Caudoviricetes sp.]